MGRPSKYQDEYALQAEKLCLLGATDAELADFFEVNISTITRWKHDYPAFCASIKGAKDLADARVERSLYAKAMGYEHDEVDIRVIEGRIVQTPIRKHYPPDTTAGIFWLKNRKPDRWRDIKAVELTGEAGGPLRIVATSTDESL